MEEVYVKVCNCAFIGFHRKQNPQHKWPRHSYHKLTRASNGSVTTELQLIMGYFSFL